MAETRLTSLRDTQSQRESHLETQAERHRAGESGSEDWCPRNPFSPAVWWL